MNAEILAVGTELLLGQIVNTNAAFISRRLADVGVHVYYQTVVGDNAERLRQAVELARTRADILIFTGGLGPTKDDLTKETIAAVLGARLVHDEAALSYIEDYFARTGRPFTENNRKQALVLQGSTVFPNDHGMAPGMGLQQGDKLYVLLPGPPKEMNPMFTSYVEPFLQRLAGSDALHSRVLRFFGIGESQLEHVLQDIIDSQSNPTIAPLASEGEVTLRLTAKHALAEEASRMLDAVEAQIMDRVGEYLYGYDDETLHEKAVAMLRSKSFSLSCAESLTGGLFSERITSVPGVSSLFRGGIVCYSNDVKQQVLRVPAEVLQTDGAVSAACAKLLAENVRELLGTDVGISFTGVAGPDSLEGKQPGTVYIGISIQGQPSAAVGLQLGGSRPLVRERAVKYGLYHLYRKLEEL
ncbi:competence/damage-inducible protein A [Ectobacillus ponti]|uniref:Putative competence-damage inducible protein n=1 Tax=Ectobacillus ponti TaxID=2961894 RepID=A0AA41X5I3_9BACI|nr:competence/damage-inducible protein A [Ectobacillus ponti]MCP8969067.1 competence/damage-inducible protein A [Ectobacillus ponti]